MYVRTRFVLSHVSSIEPMSDRRWNNTSLALLVGNASSVGVGVAPVAARWRRNCRTSTRYAAGPYTDWQCSHEQKSTEPNNDCRSGKSASIGAVAESASGWATAAGVPRVNAALYAPNNVNVVAC